MRKKSHLILVCCIGFVLIFGNLIPILQQYSFTKNSVKINPYVNAILSANLTIDFSTFLGGKDKDHGYSATITDKGECYVTGLTGSNDFPLKNAFDETLGGNLDAFITKFAFDGSLLFSSYLGGSSRDRAFAIAAGDDGSCYVLGNTNSSNFPTKNAFNSTFSGYEDVFVSKFSSDGVLLWSTYFGGNDFDRAQGISVAKDGSCYITGRTSSVNFPTKEAYSDTYNGGYDVFVSKFDTEGGLLWSTYLGGSYSERVGDIVVSNDGSCYVTGETDSVDFPVKNAFDDSYNGDSDTYISKFSTEGSLLWSTFLGGVWWDVGHSITAASDGSCYVTGYTVSSEFPVQNAFNETYDDWGDAFVAKFSASGGLLWSTFLGGNGPDRGCAITTSKDDSCYITGYTASTNFPTKNAYDFTKNDGYDVFASKFSLDGVLLWSTYLGGSSGDEGRDIAVTNNGYCYIVGITYSDDFPMINAVDRESAKSECFVTKFIEPLEPVQPTFLYGFLGIMTVVLLAVIVLYIKRK